MRVEAAKRLCLQMLMHGAHVSTICSITARKRPEPELQLQLQLSLPRYRAPVPSRAANQAATLPLSSFQSGGGQTLVFP